MTIETLYDVRDRVWFMPMLSDTPVCGVVEKIEIKIGGNSCSAVYSVSHNKVCYELASGDLYPTKEALLQKSMTYEMFLKRLDVCRKVVDIAKLCFEHPQFAERYLSERLNNL